MRLQCWGCEDVCVPRDGDWQGGCGPAKKFDFPEPLAPTAVTGSGRVRRQPRPAGRQKRTDDVVLRGEGVELDAVLVALEALHDEAEEAHGGPKTDGGSYAAPPSLFAREKKYMRDRGVAVAAGW